MNYSRSKPRILFLYTELAGYFIACLKKLKKINDADILVVHWDINREAPFTFSFPEDIKFIEKRSLSIDELTSKVQSFNPDFIYSSGWADKDYLKIISNFKKKKIPKVIVLDNPWQKRFKQYIACLISRFAILPIFTDCWVSGERQKKYAIKLGFKNKNIITGMYSADVDYYMNLGMKYSPEKAKVYPKRFIYLGRYIFSKGLPDLWEAFKEWKKETNGDWELWCLGTGDIEPDQSPGIKHFGFIQPNDIERFIRDVGVFILPSHYEPWGVALHEFVAAGFPVICSDNVCAAEKFVQNKKNGFIYTSGNKQQLKECIAAITQKSSAELIAMGEISRNLSLQITPVTWSENIMNLIEKYDTENNGKE